MLGLIIAVSDSFLASRAAVSDSVEVTRAECVVERLTSLRDGVSRSVCVSVRRFGGGPSPLPTSGIAKASMSKPMSLLPAFDKAAMAAGGKAELLDIEGMQHEAALDPHRASPKPPPAFFAHVDTMVRFWTGVATDAEHPETAMAKTAAVLWHPPDTASTLH